MLPVVGLVTVSVVGSRASHCGTRWEAAVQTTYDPITGQNPGRSEVRALLAGQQTGVSANGVAAAAAPLAAELGAQALREGGNAYDAALTAALCETVLLPPKCGLAGDLVALCLEPEADEPDALIAIGGAAAGLADVATSGRLTVTGPASVGVPGAPAGYAALADRATFDRQRLAGPASDLARSGFAWAPVLDYLIEPVLELLREQNPGGTVYLPGGAPNPVHSVVRLPGLAEVLEEWIHLGGALMSGPVGRALSKRVLESGGVITEDDLQHGSAEWTRPVRARIGGLDLWSTPEPTHGPSLLGCVTHAGSMDSVAGLWQSVLASVEHRSKTLGDTLRDEGTSAVAAVDADGRVVVVIHSNSFPRFGSGLVLEDYQLILSNRAGRGYSTIPGHPNFPVPGRRPATTLHAWAAGFGTPKLVGGTPGGLNQMIWNAQTLRQIALGERDLGTLVTSPRWAWNPVTDLVQVESDCDADTLAHFAGVSSTVNLVPPMSLHSVQVIADRPQHGDPRRAAIDPREGASVANA